MIHIISTGGECEKFVSKYALSILMQDYPKEKYMVHIFEDYCKDNTGALLDQYFSGIQNVFITHSKEKFWGGKALHTLMSSDKIKNDDIVCIVDLDDWLPDKDVLKRVESYYTKNPHILFTFGDYMVFDGEEKTYRSINKMPKTIKGIRKENFTTTHLKTWKHKIYKRIRIQDLKDKNGNFFRACQDAAIVYPMLEMAGINKILFTKDINYIYNRANPLNEDKVTNLQISSIKEISEKPTYCNNLIYYTSFGEKYATLTNISIETLIDKGRYRGEIIVICDDYFEKNNANNVKTVNVQNEIGNLHPCFARIMFAHKINANQYEQIMYLDSDIEVLKDINPMFIAKDKIVYTNEVFTHSQLPFKGLCCSSAFTMDEYLKYGSKLLVNAGSYCVDAKLFYSFIREWKKIMSDYKLTFGIDQSTLNLLIYRGSLKTEAWDKNIINFDHSIPQSIFNTKEGIIKHYLEDTKENMILKHKKV